MKRVALAGKNDVRRVVAIGNANEYLVDGVLSSEATLPKDLAYLPEVQAASRHYRLDPKSKSVQEMRNLGQIHFSEDEEEEVAAEKEPVRLPVVAKSIKAQVRSPQIKTEPRPARQQPVKELGGTQPISSFQIPAKKGPEISEATPTAPNGLASICKFISQAKIDAETGEQSG